jgi:hypothetical protein
MKLTNLLKIKGNQSDLIRLGPNKDGGYVVDKTSLSKSDILYTYGVGDCWDFEIDYANLFPNKTVRMFDPTIGDLHVDNPSIKFYSDGLYGNSEDDTSFQDHVINFGDETKKIFLKIDVEGAEYNFFNFVNLSKLSNVTGMVVEFHELYFQRRFDNFKNILSKILTNFDIVHVHGNNFTQLVELSDGYKFPSTPEITFLRKELNSCTEYSTRHFPLKGLDYKNATDREEYFFII